MHPWRVDERLAGLIVKLAADAAALFFFGVPGARLHTPQFDGGVGPLNRRIGLSQVSQMNFSDYVFRSRIDHGVRVAHFSVPHILSKLRRSSQSVTAASNAASSTSAMLV